MAFVPYVDYDFYVGVFGGNSVTEDSFSEYERKSRFIIDKHTFNRVKNALNKDEQFLIPEEIKIAQCAIIDQLYKADMNGGGAVASETVSKHSVTYYGVKTIDESIADTVKLYLSGSPWTYYGGGTGYEDK